MSIVVYCPLGESALREALAARVAVQSENIQGAGDEVTSFQDEVASGTATFCGGRVLRASKHLDFVAQETVF